jgi:hypothetical protein
LQDLIARLRKFSLPFHPPSTPEQLDHLAAALNIDELDELLRALYLDHNGTPEYSRSSEFALRLMSIDQVLHFAEAVESWHFPPEICFLWSDDNSNYAGVYVSGELKGKVCFLEHDSNTGLEPQFRSVRDFVEAMLNLADQYDDDEDIFIDISTLVTDYPLLKEMPETDAEDMALAEHFIRLYEQTADDDLSDYYAACAMQLLPLSASEKLIPFMKSDGWGASALACRLAGWKRYLPAIPHLVEAARTVLGNRDWQAMNALGDMGTPEAKIELIRLANSIDLGRIPALQRALEAYGIGIKQTEAGWYYREPYTDKWLPPIK